MFYDDFEAATGPWYSLLAKASTVWRWRITVWVLTRTNAWFPVMTTCCLGNKTANWGLLKAGHCSNLNAYLTDLVLPLTPHSYLSCNTLAQNRIDCSQHDLSPVASKTLLLNPVGLRPIWTWRDSSWCQQAGMQLTKALRDTCFLGLMSQWSQLCVAYLAADVYAIYSCTSTPCRASTQYPSVTKLLCVCNAAPEQTWCC